MKKKAELAEKQAEVIKKQAEIAKNKNKTEIAGVKLGKVFIMERVLFQKKLILEAKNFTKLNGLILH